MSEKFKSVPDPIVNDILYAILYNATAEQKRNLQGKYLKAAMSEKAAKAFIRTASDEDRKYMFSKLGFRFAWTFYREDFTGDALRAILKDFDENNKARAFKEMIKRGVVISGDREYNRLLGLMSAAIHHPAYYLDLSFLTVGFHIRNWKKRFFNPADLTVREADENSNTIAKFILQSSLCLDFCKSLTGINGTEMKILLYLYPHAHAKISESYLLDYFNGYIKAPLLTVSIKNLQKSGLIESDGKKEKSFVISAEGVNKVSEYFKTVFLKINK